MKISGIILKEARPERGSLALFLPYLTSWQRFVQIDKTLPPHPPHTPPTPCTNKNPGKIRFSIDFQTCHMMMLPFQFAYNLGSGEATLVYNSTRVDDGLWHRIRATRLDQTASLMVSIMILLEPLPPHPRLLTPTPTL